MVKNPVVIEVRLGSIQSQGKGPRGNSSEARVDSRPLRDEVESWEEVRTRLTYEVMFWSLTSTCDWTRAPEGVGKGT